MRYDYCIRALENIRILKLIHNDDLIASMVISVFGFRWYEYHPSSIILVHEKWMLRIKSQVTSEKCGEPTHSSAFIQIKCNIFMKIHGKDEPWVMVNGKSNLLWNAVHRSLRNAIEWMRLASERACVHFYESFIWAQNENEVFSVHCSFSRINEKFILSSMVDVRLVGSKRTKMR